MNELNETIDDEQNYVKHIPPSKQRKTTRKNPNAAINAAKARESRMRKLEELKMQQQTRNDKYVQDDSDESESDDEVIVYQPKMKSKRTGHTIKPALSRQSGIGKEDKYEDVIKQLRQEIDELKIKPKLEPPVKTQKDHLVDTLTYRILNF